MSQRNSFTKWILWGAIVVTAMGSGIYYLYDEARKTQIDLPVYANVPEFSFIERSGEPFGDAEMTGKINVVSFFFTSCTEACPTMMSEMRHVYRWFSDAKDFQIVSISVDPGTDSLSVLQAYAEANGIVDNRWLLLRESAEKVNNLAEKGFLVSGTQNHSNHFILVDAQKRVRGYYDSHDKDRLRELREHVVALLGSL